MKRIVVFGSINMDIVTFCATHPVVGETVMGTKLAYFPGGKGANQAIAAARAAGASFLIGSVGADDFGMQMLAHLQKNNVDTSAVAQIKHAPTGVAIIVVDKNGRNSVIVTPGANALTRAPKSLPASVESASVVLAQLETPLSEVLTLFQQVRAAGGTTILNPTPFQLLPPALLQRTSVIIVNEHEWSQLIGQPLVKDPDQLLATLPTLTLPVPCCLITLGAAGFILARHGEPPRHFSGHAVTATDTTGAGDCFAGWFAAELANGLTLETAAIRANAAAALSVTRLGAGSSIPTKAEVDAFDQ